MKNVTCLAALAAIALSGVVGIENFPLVAVSVRAETEAASLATVAKNFSPEKNLDLSGKRVAYKLPAGISAKIVGTTYEQLVDFDGKIRKPISPKTTKLTFELSNKSGKTALTPTFEIAVPVAKINFPKTEKANAKPHVVPAIQEWRGGENGTAFVPAKNFKIFIVGDNADAHPSLRERAALFAEELSEIFGRKIEVSEAPEKALPDNGIFLVVHAKKSNAPTPGKEGYRLRVSEKNIRVIAEDSLGAFWGTRTILQVFKQYGNTFPCGIAVDYPQYPLRGFMYDVGRKPATLEAVKDVLKTMAYYKLNDYQLHLNDNFIWLHRYTDSPCGKNATAEQKKQAIRDVLDAAPTAFRLESDLVGKNGIPLTATDYFYTKKDFGALIDLAKLYGVVIVPELDVPGHAMSFVRLRPELMYRGAVHKPNDVERTAMLDASKDIFDPATGRTYLEETLAFVQGVFDEFLVGKNNEEPVFRDAPIHIGTDEYYGSAEDYRAFADAMLKYAKDRGRTPRLWGSLSVKNGKTPVISDGVQIDIWNHGWQNPKQAFDAGFDIINILDATSYIVPNGKGNVGGYGDLLNLPFLYSQDWQPNKMGPTTLIAGHPKMLGAQWACWNDNAFRADTGLTDYDIYDRIRKTCAVIAEKTWNTGEDIPFADFMKIVDAVGYSPLSNPEYKVNAVDDDLFRMEFEKIAPRVDLSGNGNDATELHNAGFAEGKFGTALELRGNASFMKTPLRGIAPDYVAEFYVYRDENSPDNAPQTLFSSPAGKILAVQKETGKVGITRDTWDFSFDYTLPKNRWVKLSFVAQGRSVKLFVNDKEIGAPVRHKFPETHEYSTLVFPLEYIGAKENAFVGKIDSLKITRINAVNLANVVPAEKIKSVRANSEHGVGADGDATKLIDGDPATYWHSKYNPKDNPPFEIVIEFTEPQELDAVAFLPRQNSDNGNVKRAKLFLKTGEPQWKKVAEFRDDSVSRNIKKLEFSKQAADAIKFVITDGNGGFGTIAEIYPLRASKNDTGVNTRLAQCFSAAKAVQKASGKPHAKLDAAIEKYADAAADPNCAEGLQADAVRALSEALND